MKKLDKQNILVIVLSLLLIIAVGYIGYGYYSNVNARNQMNAAQMGYEQAVVQLFRQAASCQQVPLRVGNQTINLVAVECLQKSAE